MQQMIVNIFNINVANIVRQVLVNKGEEERVEGTHGLQMLDGSPLARLPTMPRFDFSLTINIVNYRHYQTKPLPGTEGRV